MGRAKKYHTKLERVKAQRLASQRYYYNNKEERNKKNTLYYYQQKVKKLEVSELSSSAVIMPTSSFQMTAF